MVWHFFECQIWEFIQSICISTFFFCFTQFLPLKNVNVDRSLKVKKCQPSYDTDITSLMIEMYNVRSRILFFSPPRRKGRLVYCGLRNAQNCRKYCRVLSIFKKISSLCSPCVTIWNDTLKPFHLLKPSFYELIRNKAEQTDAIFYVQKTSISSSSLGQHSNFVYKWAFTLMILLSTQVYFTNAQHAGSTVSRTVNVLLPISTFDGDVQS